MERWIISARAGYLREDRMFMHCILKGIDDCHR